MFFDFACLFQVTHCEFQPGVASFAPAVRVAPKLTVWRHGVYALCHQSHWSYATPRGGAW